MMKDFTEKDSVVKGGSPVAVVSDLTKEEFLAVYYFRCWYEGIEALQVVENSIKLMNDFVKLAMPWHSRTYYFSPKKHFYTNDLKIIYQVGGIYD